jgi:hypothetical protein
MPLLILILLATSLCASANPRPEGPVYIASEHLTMSVSPTNTSFAGTFTFALTEGPIRWSGTNVVYGGIDLLIWIPEGGMQDLIGPAVRTGDRLTPPRSATKRLTDALALEISIPGQGQWWPDFEEVHYVKEAKTAGFRTLVCGIGFLPKTVESETAPVRISYRQPSHRVEKGGQFFYLPIFDSLPKKVSTADTNRYCITVRAEQGCSLVFTNGSQVCVLHSGQSAVCRPGHFQAIQGTAWPEANQQGGANGRQPFGSETNWSSAAAASRRSP